MKNKFRFLVFLFCCLTVTSVWAQKLSIIRVDWKSANTTKMELFTMKNGYASFIASSEISNDGSFAFAFFPETEGFYFIGKNLRLRPDRYMFYLKPGDNLQFQIDAYDWSLVGENSPENQEIKKWYDFVRPVQNIAFYFVVPEYNLSFGEFFPKLETLISQSKTFPKAQTPNKKFNTEFEFCKKYSLLEMALLFIHTPRYQQPSVKDFTQYYRDISILEFTSSPYLLNYPGYLDLIKWGYRVSYMVDTSLTQEERTKRDHTIHKDHLRDLNLIANDEVKGEFILDNARYCQTHHEIMNFKTEYGKYLVTDSQKARFKNIVTKLEQR